MAFLVVRQFTAMVQCVLTVIEELVSMQIVKYTTFLSRESIMDIEDEATKRLEARSNLSYPERAGAWWFSRFPPPSFIAVTLRNTGKLHSKKIFWLPQIFGSKTLEFEFVSKGGLGKRGRRVWVEDGIKPVDWREDGDGD
ncbi:hypothetical protein IEQ34_014973 [Dendrobium chrysotoxum]|uniref:Uncharacterized protein n=1 Tax=Dendrobium chrysotoxum TaxID=161865 RepID=A0AAV7GKM2_DENCH|nr:hypothetical protein IEQ34_014973 [Dendrobium chrysotoxum]